MKFDLLVFHLGGPSGDHFVRSRYVPISVIIARVIWLFSFVRRAILPLIERVLEMRKRANKVLIPSVRNIYNFVRFGPLAPKFNERLILYPGMDEIFHGKKYLPRHEMLSAKVITSAWPVSSRENIRESRKFKICYRRWVEGMTWEEAGAYEWMLKAIERKGSVDGCHNMDEIRIRFEALDEIFSKVSKEGRFHNNFSIRAHIGPDRALYFGHGGGHHRLAISLILRIPIEAQVGLVHVEAIPWLNEIRNRKKYMLSRARF